MFNRREFILASAAVAALPQAASAQAWVKLGERHVQPVADHDRIHVGVASGPFRAVKLLVRGNDLFIADFDVRFANGGHQDLAVRFMIPQGGETRVIDLKGGARNIAYVDFNYGKPVNGRGATIVELWGLR
jgi:hypothetical protein